MVRATYARVLARFNAVLPTGWVEAQVTALCTQADYIIDGYTNPVVISTTSNLAIEVAVDVVMRMMRQSDMYKKSAGASSGDGYTFPDVVILTPEIKERIDALKNVSYWGTTTVDYFG